MALPGSKRLRELRNRSGGSPSRWWWVTCAPCRYTWATAESGVSTARISPPSPASNVAIPGRAKASLSESAVRGAGMASLSYDGPPPAIPVGFASRSRHRSAGAGRGRRPGREEARPAGVRSLELEARAIQPCPAAGALERSEVRREALLHDLARSGAGPGRWTCRLARDDAESLRHRRSPPLRVGGEADAKRPAGGRRLPLQRLEARRLQRRAAGRG